MQIIKNAAGKWLIEATDEEILWLDVKVNNYGCDKCPWKDDDGCDGFDHATCMDPSWRISAAAEQIRSRNESQSNA